MFHVPCLGNKFRSIINTDHCWLSPELQKILEHTNNAKRWRRKVCFHCQHLTIVVIDNIRQSELSAIS